MNTALLIAALSLATPLPDGFDLNALSPVLPGISTTGNVIARNPFDDTLWMSNSRDLYQLDGLGNVISSESLRGVDGGPLGLDGTTDIVFDASGALYINRNKGSSGLSPILKRAYGSSTWSSFSDVFAPRAMEFDSAGKLIVLGGNGDPTLVGEFTSVSTLGAATALGPSQGESFVIDPITGHYRIPQYIGTGIDDFNPTTGVLTTQFSWVRDPLCLYEAIGLTAGGNYLVGVNLGESESPPFENRSQLLIIHGITGERIVLGDDIVFGQIPVDLRIEDRILISNFGSAQAWEIVGNLDALLAIPEPGTGLLVMLGLAVLGWKRRVTCRS